MEALFQQYWWVIFIVIGAGALYFGWWVEKKRSEALMRTAMEMGYQYEPESLIHAQMPQMPLFQRGRAQKSKNVLRRQSMNQDAVLFDFEYVTGSGKNRSTHRATVAAFRNSGTSLPQFQLAPETWMERIGEKFGLQDIDFEAHPEFSKRYVLKAKDEAAARATFSAAAIGYLESLPATWNIEGWGEWVILFRAGQRVKPEEMQQFLNETMQVAGGLMSHMARRAAF